MGSVWPTAGVGSSPSNRVDRSRDITAVVDQRRCTE